MNARLLLLPFSWIYGAVVAARNACYDMRIFSVTRVGTPVISVGNITAGGTGKTPLVEYIAAKLLGAGARPAVLSRGYRRTTRGTLLVSDGISVRAGADAAGDEPAQIARKLAGCVVVVDEDRVRGARFIEKEFHPDAIVLDDGFQHRALGRDLDIVVLGSTERANGAALLPAGNGREPLRSLERADLVVLNGAPDRPAGTAAAPAGHGRSGFVRMEYRLTGCALADAGGGIGRPIGHEELAGGRFVAFCGIGNPASFAATLSAAGLKPESFLAFPDHHRYAPGDVAAIAAALARTGARYAVTTEKDAVRLDGESMPEAPFRGSLVVARIEAAMTGGGEALDRAVLSVARRGAP